MVKLTNPLNKDGILYQKGAILTLSLKDEAELVANGLAEMYPLVQIEKEDACKEVDLHEEVEVVVSDEVENKEKVEKEDTKAKETKKTSTRIGRTSKK